MHQRKDIITRVSTPCNLHHTSQYPHLISAEYEERKRQHENEGCQTNDDCVLIIIRNRSSGRDLFPLLTRRNPVLCFPYSSVPVYCRILSQ